MKQIITETNEGAGANQIGHRQLGLLSVLHLGPGIV